MTGALPLKIFSLLGCLLSTRAESSHDSSSNYYHYLYTPPQHSQSLVLLDNPVAAPSSVQYPNYNDYSTSAEYAAYDASSELAPAQERSGWKSESEAKRRLRLTLYLTQQGAPQPQVTREVVYREPQVQQHQSDFLYRYAPPIHITGARTTEILLPTSAPTTPRTTTPAKQKKKGKRRPKKFRRNRNKKQRERELERNGAECKGFCTNMFACMIRGGKPVTSRSKNRQMCRGIFDVCCTRWGARGSGESGSAAEGRGFGSSSIFSGFPNRHGGGGHRTPKHLRFTGQQQSNRFNRPQKSGRTLAIEDVSQNSISYSSGSSSAEILASVPAPTTVFTPATTSNILLPHQYNSYESNSINDVTANFVYGSGKSKSKPYYKDSQCGISKNHLYATRRIMGGLDAGYGQFPWTAHIKIKGPGIDKECGGTLINRRWIATAGHCTQYCVTVPGCAREIPQHEITYKVILGEYDQLEAEPTPPDSYLAIDVIRHPAYRNVMRLRENGFLESEPRYDVALLMLDRDVVLAPNVAPICLPPLAAQLEGLTPGTMGTVVGWGRIGKDDLAPHSNVLQAATVPILSDSECLAETGLANFDDQVCAGESESDISACPGDSGGALQVQDAEGRWMMVGIVSNGPSVCGLQPVVFHKIAKTIDWIDKVVERHLPNVP